MVSINSLVAPFPYPISPLQSTTPLTYREGITVLGLIEEIKNWVIQVVEPELHGALDKAIAEFTEGLRNAENTIVNSKIEWQNLFDEFMADIVVHLEGLNDQAVSNLVETNTSLTGISMRNLIERHTETVYNVKGYGAKGDGITDDTTAIQNVVDLIMLNGSGVMYYPAGEYKQNGYVLIPSNVTITGSPGAVIRKTTGLTTACVFVALGGTNPGYGSGSQNVTISNLTFRGDLGVGASMCALAAHRLSGLTVYNCEFLETIQNGHTFDLQGCENVIIETSRFAGIKTIAGRAYVEHIQIDSSTRSGVSFPQELAITELYDGTPTRNVEVRYNTFNAITVGDVTYPAASPVGSHTYVDGRPYTGINIHHNTISDVVEGDGGYPGILHFLGARDVRIEDNTISADSAHKNVFVRTFSGASAIAPGDVSLESPTNKTALYPVFPDEFKVRRNTVTGLTVPATGQRAIWVYGASEKMLKNLEITDNVFKDCPDTNGVQYLIQTTWADSPILSNNKSYGLGPGCVYAGVSTKPIIENNFSENSSSYVVGVIGCSTPIVKNNVGKDSFYGVSINGCENITFTGNDITINQNAEAVVINNPMVGGGGFMKVTDNHVSSSASTVTQTLTGIGLSGSFTKGLVSNNTSTKYGICVNKPLGFVYGENAEF